MSRVGNTGTFAFLLLTIAGSVDGVFTQPRVTPENLTDANGNFADVHSRISWAPVPAGRPRSAANGSADGSSLLDGLYVMAEQFVSVVMPQSKKEGKCQLCPVITISKSSAKISRFGESFIFS